MKVGGEWTSGGSPGGAGGGNWPPNNIWDYLSVTE